jgi:hypothetical protein
LTSNFAKTTAPGFDVELGWLVALGIHALQERELQRITKREE